MTDRNRRLNRLEGQIPEPEKPRWNFSELSDAELAELEDLAMKEDSGADLTLEEKERLRQFEARCTETAKDRTRIEIYSPGPDGPILKRRVSVPVAKNSPPVVVHLPDNGRDGRPYAHLSDEELERAIRKAEARRGQGCATLPRSKDHE
jgi:hypothetical protein